LQNEVAKDIYFLGAGKPLNLNASQQRLVKDALGIRVSKAVEYKRMISNIKVHTREYDQSKKFRSSVVKVRDGTSNNNDYYYATVEKFILVEHNNKQEALCLLLRFNTSGVKEVYGMHEVWIQESQEILATHPSNIISKVIFHSFTDYDSGFLLEYTSQHVYG
jgi:hypothetical protein